MNKILLKNVIILTAILVLLGWGIAQAHPGSCREDDRKSGTCGASISQPVNPYLPPESVEPYVPPATPEPVITTHPECTIDLYYFWDLPKGTTLECLYRRGVTICLRGMRCFVVQ